MRKENKLFCIFVLLFILTTTISCDNDSNAQQTGIEFSATYSGSFITASVNTDTNEDGRPSSYRTYEGESNLGLITLTIIDEFAQPIPPVNCPENNLEFDLVRGSFVLRLEGGDLLLGEINSGFSCFDAAAGLSEITEEGQITNGTGEFVDAGGSIEFITSSIFLNTTAVNGFASGGSTGSIKATIQ